MKTLLAYVRKSIYDDDSSDRYSPARQRSAIEQYARARGFIVDWFEDLDISGRYEANRPGWRQLLASLDDRGVAGVIVESIERSHRNVREFLAFYDDLLAPRGQASLALPAETR